MDARRQLHQAMQEAVLHLTIAQLALRVNLLVQGSGCDRPLARRREAGATTDGVRGRASVWDE